MFISIHIDMYKHIVKELPWSVMLIMIYSGNLLNVFYNLHVTALEKNIIQIFTLSLYVVIIIIYYILNLFRCHHHLLSFFIWIWFSDLLIKHPAFVSFILIWSLEWQTSLFLIFELTLTAFSIIERECGVCYDVIFMNL